MLDLPLGVTVPIAAAAAMVNVVGLEDGSDPAPDRTRPCPARASTCMARARPGRKLGHVTASAATPEEALNLPVRPLMARRAMTEPIVGVVMALTDPPVMGQVSEVLQSSGSPPRRVWSRRIALVEMIAYGQQAAFAVIIAGAAAPPTSRECLPRSRVCR